MKPFMRPSVIICDAIFSAWRETSGTLSKYHSVIDLLSVRCARFNSTFFVNGKKKDLIIVCYDLGEINPIY